MTTFTKIAQKIFALTVLIHIMTPTNGYSDDLQLPNDQLTKVRRSIIKGLSINDSAVPANTPAKGFNRPGPAGAKETCQTATLTCFSYSILCRESR